MFINQQHAFVISMFANYRLFYKPVFTVIRKMDTTLYRLSTIGLYVLHVKGLLETIGLEVSRYCQHRNK